MKNKIILKRRVPTSWSDPIQRESIISAILSHCQRTTCNNIYVEAKQNFTILAHSNI